MIKNYNATLITVLSCSIILFLALTQITTIFASIIASKPLVNMVIGILIFASFFYSLKNINKNAVKIIVATVATVLPLSLMLTTKLFKNKLFDEKAINLESLPFFLDGITLWLVWLISVVAIVLFFGITKTGEYKIKNYYKIFSMTYSNILLIILGLIFICFTTKNIFTFFIFFEMILLPLVYHIVIQGSRVNRINAIKYLVLYTLVGSIFLWIPIIYFIEILGSTDFETLRWFVEESTNSGTRKILFLSMFLGFCFKVPLVPFHQWLIIAHVEAPTSGSIILAALLLKVGGYGLYRFAYNIFPIETYCFSFEIIMLAIFGYTYATLLAIRQIDVKRFIAYTSISHMNFSLIGLFSSTEVGIVGFLYTMLSHGIIATGLFYLVGYLYNTLGYRDTLRISSLSEILPIFSIFWFLFSIANMGMPMFSAFPGELYIFIAMAEINSALLIYILVGFFFTGVYTFLQVNKLIFSNYKGFTSSILLGKVSDISNEAFIVITFLLTWTLLLGVCPDIVIKNIEI